MLRPWAGSSGPQGDSPPGLLSCVVTKPKPMTNHSSKPEGEEASSLSTWASSQDLDAAESATAQHGFTPGTMLAGRYRVVALLGQGGMGQIYRADDTKLGQPVALKFVRGTLSPDRLQRLYDEVRIGREVSHPHVCRLYDVVELDGQTFIAMEYVDGEEDLDSLLSRIGRLPSDKAMDIARDLAAGLAAVHEKGVVHRDLKPANVMIDGRGQARLTDFGLAVASDRSDTDSSAGTPAYMSPEQLSGREVSFRSDIYGLGLILYEMFTGRRFFDAKSMDELHMQHRQAKKPRLASASHRLDPAVERAILHCLEESPRERPASARSVVATLPGSDPLEAAVAAGETPSPDMVAAAGKVGDLTPAVAWTWLLAALGGLVLVAHLSDRETLLGKTMFPKTPEALVERAQDLLSRLGLGKAADAAWSFEADREYLDHVRRNRSPARWEEARRGPFARFHFFYRESPRRLVAANRDGVVRRRDPPANLSGMTEVVMDPRGRVTSFLAVPPQLTATQAAWPEPDWSPLFQDAGLDPAGLRSVEPRWAAPVDSDHKAAWEGAHPDEPEVQLRIEAAAYHGQPVWFAVLPPWSKPERMVTSSSIQDTVPVGEIGVWILALAMPVGGLLLARRNLRLGRGDKDGALRVAIFVFCVYSLARILRASHVASFGDELSILIRLLAHPALWAAQVWLLYIALEPSARRRWPHALISWRRVLSGSFRDPLVGRHVLLGCVAGSASGLIFNVTLLGPAWFGLPPLLPQPFLHGSTLATLQDVGFRLFVNQFSAVLFSMVFLFMLVLLRLLLRNDLLAVVLWCLLVGSPMVGGNVAFEWVGGLFRAIVLYQVLTRGGLLALAVSLFFMFSILEVPLTLDLSAWFATRAVPVVLVLVGVAIYGFHTSLGGKPLFGRALLED